MKRNARNTANNVFNKAKTIVTKAAGVVSAKTVAAVKLLVASFKPRALQSPGPPLRRLKCRTALFRQRKVWRSNGAATKMNWILDEFDQPAFADVLIQFIDNILNHGLVSFRGVASTL